MRGAGPYSHPDARYGMVMCRCAAIGPNDYRLSREAIMNKNLLVSILMALTVTAAAAQAPTKDALIARAKSFELDTPYVPPPGDPLTHHAAGFAKVMCSAIFMTGLAPDLPAEGLTAAFVVTWKGRLIAERYAEGLTAQTPLEGWSMGKSVTATLFGILVKDGIYDLDQPAPIPEWQTPGDPRAKIRIADILHMSSGLRIKAPQDPDYDPTGPYPDHVYLYTGGIDSFHYAATRPLQWPPNTVGRYHNTDPVLISYLIRLGVEKSGDEYLSFPQRVLFDKLGIRTMVIETDPFGNFLGQGYEVASGRAWARLGNLFLQGGAWNGERILPQGYTKFVSTLAPACAADNRPIYGALF